MRRHTLVTALIAVAFMGYAHAAVLKSIPGPIEVSGGGMGTSLNAGLSRAVGATDTMYVGFTIEPLAFSGSNAVESFAALSMYSGTVEGFSVGNAWNWQTYGAFNGGIADTNINIVEDVKLQIPRRIVYKVKYNGNDRSSVTVWKDPDFDPKQRAFYYARVLEIPTPRWTAYDAKRFGIQPLPGTTMTLQERAYTSPIWYTPGG